MGVVASSVPSKEMEMLARRFTIVCLLVMLFGMGFAMLVAEAGRSKRDYPIAGGTSCFLNPTSSCGSSARN